MLWTKPRFHKEVQNNSKMAYTMKGEQRAGRGGGVLKVAGRGFSETEKIGAEQCSSRLF